VFLSQSTVHARPERSRPRPRYAPLARRGASRLRLGMRLARGVGTGAVARAEGVPKVEVDRLIEEPDFAGLIAAYRDLAALPEADRLARLTALAFDVLELALTDGDPMVAVFVIEEAHAGRNPARTLAEGVERAFAGAGRERLEPIPVPEREPAPADTPPAEKAAAEPRRLGPGQGLRRGARTRLNRGLLLEAGLGPAASQADRPAAVDPETADTAPATPATAASATDQPAGEAAHTHLAPSAAPTSKSRRPETPPRRPRPAPAPAAKPAAAPARPAAPATPAFAVPHRPATAVALCLPDPPAPRRRPAKPGGP